MDPMRTLAACLLVLAVSAANGMPPPSTQSTPPTIAPIATEAPYAPGIERLLTRNMRGKDVRLLQLRLIELGYLGGTADGVFGGQTERAVKRFQFYHDLEEDGIAGLYTLQILFSEDAQVAPPEPVITASPVPTATPTLAPTLPPIQTPTPTPVPTASPVPTATPTPIPTPMPPPSPPPTPSPVPTAQVTASPEPTEAATATPVVTEAPPATEAPTEAPTQEATELPTDGPTQEATEAPTDGPTEAPTVEPTVAPPVGQTIIPRPEILVMRETTVLPVVAAQDSNLQYWMFPLLSLCQSLGYTNEITENAYHLVLTDAEQQVLSDVALSYTTKPDGSLDTVLVLADGEVALLEDDIPVLMVQEPAQEGQPLPTPTMYVSVEFVHEILGYVVEVDDAGIHLMGGD